MINTPTLPTLDSPKLLDTAIAGINTTLSGGLSWLDHTFGRCERIVELKDDKPQYFPAIYSGSNEYFSLFPNDWIGNYSFWSASDLHKVDKKGMTLPRMESDISLIIWFRYDQVYPANHETRTIENVKNDVLAALRVTKFNPTRIYELSENIMKGYSHNEIENQFLMRPFGGLRIEGTLKYNLVC